MRGSFSARSRVSSSLMPSSTRILPRRRPLIWMITSIALRGPGLRDKWAIFRSRGPRGMAQHLPELFGDVRRHGRKHQEQSISTRFRIMATMSASSGSCS